MQKYNHITETALAHISYQSSTHRWSCLCTTAFNILSQTNASDYEIDLFFLQPSKLTFGSSLQLPYSSTENQMSIHFWIHVPNDVKQNSCYSEACYNEFLLYPTNAMISFYIEISNTDSIVYATCHSISFQLCFGSVQFGQKGNINTSILLLITIYQMNCQFHEMPWDSNT